MADSSSEQETVNANVNDRNTRALRAHLILSEIVLLLADEIGHISDDMVLYVYYLLI